MSQYRGMQQVLEAGWHEISSRDCHVINRSWYHLSGHPLEHADRGPTPDSTAPSVAFVSLGPFASTFGPSER